MLTRSDVRKGEPANVNVLGVNLKIQNLSLQFLKFYYHF